MTGVALIKKEIERKRGLAVSGGNNCVMVGTLHNNASWLVAGYLQVGWGS